VLKREAGGMRPYARVIRTPRHFKTSSVNSTCKGRA